MGEASGRGAALAGAAGSLADVEVFAAALGAALVVDVGFAEDAGLEELDEAPSVEPQAERSVSSPKSARFIIRRE